MSNELKITKGPWYINEYGRIISEHSNCSLNGIGISGAILTSGKEAEANAMFISAAPEMYEALLNMRNYMSWKFGEDDPHVKNADKALKKARGES